MQAKNNSAHFSGKVVSKRNEADGWGCILRIEISQDTSGSQDFVQAKKGELIEVFTHHAKGIESGMYVEGEITLKGNAKGSRIVARAITPR